MKVVLDANTFVSGLIVRHGPAGQIIAALLRQQFRLVTSRALVVELKDVLERPAVSQRLWIPRMALELLMVGVADAIVDVPETAVRSVSRDPDDDHVLAAAVATRADYIVAGDKDLLVLDPYEGIRIVTPREFLDVLDRSP